MEKKFIKFSENGTSMVINLAGGSETMDINSKEEGLKAIKKLLTDKKITTEEFSEMTAQILGAEKLPWSENKEISSFIDLLSTGGLLGKIITLAAMRALNDVMNVPSKQVEEACLEVCEVCGNHGIIYIKGGRTVNLNSKEEALYYLDEMKKRGDISEEEFQKVKTEVETSTLPE